MKPDQRASLWAARQMLKQAQPLKHFGSWMGEERSLAWWERLLDRVGLFDRLARCGWLAPREQAPRWVTNPGDRVVFRRPPQPFTAPSEPEEETRI